MKKMLTVSMLIVLCLNPGLGYDHEGREHGGGHGQMSFGHKKEMDERHQKEAAYRETQRAQMLQLESQMAYVKAQAFSAADEAGKNKILEQLIPLKQQKHALKVENAKHEVENIQEQMTFAQKRLEETQKRLADLEANKEDTDEPEHPPMEGPTEGEPSAPAPVS